MSTTAIILSILAAYAMGVATPFVTHFIRFVMEEDSDDIWRHPQRHDP